MESINLLYLLSIFCLQRPSLSTFGRDHDIGQSLWPRIASLAPEIVCAGQTMHNELYFGYYIRKTGAIPSPTEIFILAGIDYR